MEIPGLGFWNVLNDEQKAVKYCPFVFIFIKPYAQLTLEVQYFIWRLGSCKRLQYFSSLKSIIPGKQQCLFKGDGIFGAC